MYTLTIMHILSGKLEWPIIITIAMVNKKKSRGGLESVRLWERQRTSPRPFVIQKSLNSLVLTVLPIEMFHLSQRDQDTQLSKVSILIDIKMNRIRRGCLPMKSGIVWQTCPYIVYIQQGTANPRMQSQLVSFQIPFPGTYRKHHEPYSMPIEEKTHQ